MDVKVIAVDMDGTFLNDVKAYDRARFSQQYQALKQRGIRFVVASGNQYYQLASFFPQIADDISFVAENGGYVVHQGKEIFCAQLEPEKVQKVLDTLAGFPFIKTVLCGKLSAYVLRASGEDFCQRMRRYYHRLEVVETFDATRDTLFKFALNLPDAELSGFMGFINSELNGIVKGVSSGHGSVDLIIPGCHKAHGLRLLQEIWQVNDEEVVAFGDGGNDIEMLKQAGFSFAMANAPEPVQQAAKYQTVSNNEAGVLTVIDKVLQGEPPF